MLASIAAVPAYAGDEDEKPAYMIYIDPETGKYTTEDPARKAAPGNVAASNEPAAGESTALPALIMTVLGAAALLGVALWIRHGRHPAHQDQASRAMRRVE